MATKKKTQNPQQAIADLLSSWFVGMEPGMCGYCTEEDVMKLYDLAVNADEFDIASAIDAKDETLMTDAMTDWCKRNNAPDKFELCIAATDWFAWDRVSEVISQVESDVIDSLKDTGDNDSQLAKLQQVFQELVKQKTTVIDKILPHDQVKYQNNIDLFKGAR